jgi:hypothetical protein
MVLATISCATTKDKELDYAARMCSADPIVGNIKGAKAELEARRNKLEQIKVAAVGERYIKLSQELEHYTAEWEELHQSSQRACRDWALCQYRFGAVPQACDAARDELSQREEKARNFLLKVKSLDVGFTSDKERNEWKAGFQRVLPEYFATLYCTAPGFLDSIPYKLRWSDLHSLS